MSKALFQEIDKLLGVCSDVQTYRARLLAAFRYQETERPDCLLEDPIAQYFMQDPDCDLDELLGKTADYQENRLCRKYVQNRTLKVQYQQELEESLAQLHIGTPPHLQMISNQSLMDSKKKIQQLSADPELENLLDQFSDVLIDADLIKESKRAQRNQVKIANHEQQGKQLVGGVQLDGQRNIIKSKRILGDLLGRILALDFLVYALVDPKIDFPLYSDVQKKYNETTTKPVRQLVLFQSGFDGRAYRLQNIGDFEVFELDSRPLLDAKQKILQMAGAQINKEVKKSKIPLECKKVHYIEYSFDGTTWVDEMVKSGYKPDEPTIWLAQECIFDMHDSQVQQMMKTCHENCGKGSIYACDMYSEKGLQALKLIMKKGLIQGLQWGYPKDFEEYFQKLGWELVMEMGLDKVTESFSQGMNYQSVILRPENVIVAAFMKT